MKFQIGVKEIHIAWYEVSAENQADAIEAVQKFIIEGQPKSVKDLKYLEYDRTLDSDTWSVC